MLKDCNCCFVEIKSSFIFSISDWSDLFSFCFSRRFCSILFLSDCIFSSCCSISLTLPLINTSFSFSWFSSCWFSTFNWEISFSSFFFSSVIWFLEFEKELFNSWTTSWCSLFVFSIWLFKFVITLLASINSSFDAWSSFVKEVISCSYFSWATFKFSV